MLELKEMCVFWNLDQAAIGSCFHYISKQSGIICSDARRPFDTVSYHYPYDQEIGIDQTWLLCLWL